MVLRDKALVNRRPKVVVVQRTDTKGVGSLDKDSRSGSESSHNRWVYNRILHYKGPHKLW